MTTFNEVPVGSIIKFEGRYLLKIKQAIPDKKLPDQGCNCIMLDNLHRMTIGWGAKVELVADPDEINDLEDFELTDKVMCARMHDEDMVRPILDKCLKGHGRSDLIKQKDVIINFGKDTRWIPGEPKNAGTYILTIRDCRGHDSVVTSTKYNGKWTGFPLQTTDKIVAYKRIDVNSFIDPYDDLTVFFNAIEPGEAFEYQGKQYIRLHTRDGVHTVNSYGIDDSTYCYFSKHDRVLKLKYHKGLEVKVFRRKALDVDI